MCSEPTVTYKDGNDDVVYLINISKYVTLQDSTKKHVMKNLLGVHEQNLDFVPLPQIASQPGKVCKSAPIGGFSATRLVRRPTASICCSKPQKSGVQMKFELGIFPSDDFRFSMDTSSLPLFYRLDHNATPTPRFCPGVAAPIKILIGNVAVLKQNSNARNFVAATGVYSTQTPSQSVFTYFYGSAVDHYYHVYRNGYP